MSGKYDPNRVTNPIRRRIFRTRITRAENLVSAALILAVIGAAAWVFGQRDRYDPGERDITIDALRAGSIKEVAYQAPLVRWQEGGPAAGAAGPGVIGVSIAGMGLAGPGAAPGTDLGIFPPVLLGGGWIPDGRVETYDPGNLYEKINGQAEQYLKFDFRRLHYLTLARDAANLTVELYDQGEFRNALGVFSSQRDPARTLTEDGPLSYYRTSVGAIGLVDRYFFKITASEASPAVREQTDRVLAALPRLVAGPGASAPAGAPAKATEPFAILAKGLGVPRESIAYAKENALQYEFFRDVWFGEPKGAAGTRVFLHHAADDATAAKIEQQLVAEQRQEHEPVESAGGVTVMKHQFLGTYFGLARRGGWLFGADGAPDAESLRALLARVEKELP